MTKNTPEYFEKAIEDASQAGQKAGDEWMKNAKPKYVVVGYEDTPMLDLCGNAHVRVTDGRTKFAKYLKQDSWKSTITVPITTTYRMRQEHGLQLAIAKAALEVLTTKYGFKNLRIWDYID